MYSVIASDGNTYGPVDIATLRQWCAEGRVTPTTNIIDGVTGRTMRASDLQSIYDIFPGAPSTPSMSAPQSNPRVTSQSVQQAGPMGGRYAQPGQAYPSQPYANGPASPYMRTPVYAGPVVGQKSKVAAALLAFFFGGLGIHRFYLGYTGIGIAMLLMTIFGWILLFIPWIVVGIWSFVDFILILTGGLKDSQGYDLC